MGGRGEGQLGSDKCEKETGLRQMCPKHGLPVLDGGSIMSMGAWSA